MRANRGDGGAQVQVVRPKVMTPMADTVGFVHYEQAHLYLFEQLDKPLCGKALGRDIEEFKSLIEQRL
jgi:hypothetical protein